MKTALRYHVLSEAWYGRTNLEHASFEERITFGRYAEDGGCVWEAGVEWLRLRPGGTTAKLQVFEDAWAAPEVEKVVAALRERAQKEPVHAGASRGALASVRAALESVGFVDATERKRS